MPLGVVSRRGSSLLVLGSDSGPRNNRRAPFATITRQVSPPFRWVFPEVSLVQGVPRISREAPPRPPEHLLARPRGPLR
eukprot:5870402-Pyramimonas_sp.AAC.1